MIFVKKPYCCCCIDMTEYCGEAIMAAPCNCFGLKKYLCCGGPCYLSCAVPVFSGVKDGKAFLVQWGAALNEYYAKTGIDNKEKAIFESVKDSELDQYGAEKLETTAVVVQPAK